MFKLNINVLMPGDSFLMIFFVIRFRTSRIISFFQVDILNFSFNFDLVTDLNIALSTL